MLNQHTVFEQLLTTLRTLDNLDENRNLSKKVEGNNNIIQQKQQEQCKSIKVREEKSMKALKLDDEKGYMNKNVEGDSNDQGQPKRNTRQNRVLHISRKIQLKVP